MVIATCTISKTKIEQASPISLQGAASDKAM
jgi:hypothetical protein